LPTAPISVSHTMKRLKQQKTTEMCLGICNTEKFTFSFIYLFIYFSFLFISGIAGSRQPTILNEI
jgi:hypothetical protein